MASISVKNDKYSQNLYKPLLKCSDSVFDDILEKLSAKFKSIYNETIDITENGETKPHNLWTISVKHSKVSRNIIIVEVAYDDLTKKKQYVVTINLETKSVKFNEDYLSFISVNAYQTFLTKLISIVSDSTLFGEIDSHLNEINTIAESFRIKAISLTPTYGTCAIISSSREAAFTAKDETKLYSKDTQLLLQATPNNHYKFSAWTLNGNVVSNREDGKYEMTVKDNATYVAIFVKEKYNLVVDVDVEDVNNESEIIPYVYLAEDGVYEYNDTVTLTVKPVNGYRFVCWIDEEDNVLSNEITYKFQIENDIKVFAKLTNASEVDEDETEEEQPLESNPVTPNNPLSDETDNTTDPDE